MSGKRKSGESEPVRSLAEIRGQYGLPAGEFRVLAEGSRDRTVGTVVGREPRPPAKKMVPAKQAVMGTARLDAPAEVAARNAANHADVSVPMSPLRWWPLALGALVVPVIVGIAYLGDDAPPSDAPETSSAPAERAEGFPPPGAADEKVPLPKAAKPAVHSRRAPRAVEPAPSATSAKRDHKGLPAFPDLDEE